MSLNSRTATCGPGLLQRLVRFGAGRPSPLAARNLGLVGHPVASYCTRGVRCRCPFCFWCGEPRLTPDGSIGLGSVFGPPVGDRGPSCRARLRRIPFGRLMPLPTPPPNAAVSRPREPTSIIAQAPCGSTFGVRADPPTAAKQHPDPQTPSWTRRDHFHPTASHKTSCVPYGLLRLFAFKRSSLGGVGRC